jgi:hypothetical protein
MTEFSFLSGRNQSAKKKTTDLLQVRVPAHFETPGFTVSYNRGGREGRRGDIVAAIV